MHLFADVALGCLQFQIQNFDIICSPVWTSRDRCCDIPSRVSNRIGILSPRNMGCGAGGLGKEVASGNCVSRLKPRDSAPTAQASDPPSEARNTPSHSWKFSLTASVVVHSHKSPAESLCLINPLIAEPSYGL